MYISETNLDFPWGSRYNLALHFHSLLVYFKAPYKCRLLTARSTAICTFLVSCSSYIRIYLILAWLVKLDSDFGLINRYLWYLAKELLNFVNGWAPVGLFNRNREIRGCLGRSAPLRVQQVKETLCKFQARNSSRFRNLRFFRTWVLITAKRTHQSVPSPEKMFKQQYNTRNKNETIVSVHCVQTALTYFLNVSCQEK